MRESTPDASVFSQRTPADLEPTAIARRRRELGDAVLDLTVSNPTACGIDYPADLLDTLAGPAALRYRPEPRGLRSARETVAARYARAGRTVDPDRVLLTASTSEAYAFVFKLLCGPGDGVAFPVPSYPLFEHLARLEAVEPVPYPLVPDDGWQPDLEALRTLPDTVRAVVVVHPNNPTGSFLAPSAATALLRLAADRGWAVVADEVFLDFPLEGAGDSLAGAGGPLTFVLGGLSKAVGLPQVKLAWMAVGGDDAVVEPALERLDVVADTFLSVSTPVQEALPALLEGGAAVQRAILERCRDNLRAARAIVAATPELEILPTGGGWSTVLRFPAVADEEDVVLRLLDEAAVAVHPGYFFDFPGDGYLVISLLPPASRFTAGMERVAGVLRAIIR